MTFKTACTLDDLWEGDMTEIEVDGHAVLLVWPEGGEIRAFQGMCPHQDIPLAEGKLNGRVLMCRAHQWTFDVATGAGVNPGDCRLAQYPVKVDGESILVSVEGVAPNFAHCLNSNFPEETQVNATTKTKIAGDGYKNNRVGPILRAGPITAGVIEAAEEDNPGKAIRVDDKLAYVRIDTDGELILRRETLERALGRPFRMSELEVNLGSFAGRIETTDDYVRFFYEKTL